MIPYIVIFIVLLFFTVYCDIQGKRKNYDTYVKISAVILILLAGLRNGVGSDTHNYAAMFYGVPRLSEILSGSGYEWQNQPLWYLSNSIVRTISDHFLLFQLLHAVLFNLLLLRFLKKTTSYIFTSLLIVYCILWWNLSFEVMREAICVVLFLNAAFELKKKNIGKYLLWCLPSFFIHWFFFPIVLVLLLFYYVKPVIIVGFLSVLSIVLFVVDTSLISQVIMSLYEDYSSNEETSELLLGYLQHGTTHGYSSLNIFGIAMSFILASPFIVSGVGMYKITRNQVDIAIVILYVFLFIAQGRLVILARYLNYLIPYVVVILVNYCHQLKKESVINIYLVLMMFFLCYRGYSDFKSPRSILGDSNYNNYHIPYTSIFENPAPNRVPVEY